MSTWERGPGVSGPLPPLPDSLPNPLALFGRKVGPWPAFPAPQRGWGGEFEGRVGEPPLPPALPLKDFRHYPKNKKSHPGSLGGLEGLT